MDSLLAKIAESVSSAHTLEELARPMLEMLEAVTGCESTYLTAIDLERGVQEIVLARNSKEMRIPEGLSVPWADTLCKRALDEGRPYTNSVDEHWSDSGTARQLGIRTYVSTPVRIGSDGLYGTLCAASADRLPLPANAQYVLQLFSRLIGQHMERERLLAQLTIANAELLTRTLTDSLTGLPNRLKLGQELDQLFNRCARMGNTVLVGFFDVDGFKSVNDLHGHDCGDTILQIVSGRLKAAMRTGDMLARFGGDEFVLIGPGPAPGTAAEAASRTLEAQLKHAGTGHIRLSTEVCVYVGVSVGVIAVDPRISSKAEALKQADAAMYMAKHGSRASAM